MDAFRRGLGELLTQGVSSRIELAPLSMASVETLARSSGLAAAELYRLTGGNPFYVTEILRGGDETVPATARDVVLARAAALSRESREALEVAALIGARIDGWLLEAVAVLSTVVMDELIGSGLIVDTGSRLRFRHEIARMALEQAVPTHRRGAIHRRILAALNASGCNDEARMALHAESAGDGDATIEHSQRAARIAAGMSSHTEAVGQYQRILRFASRLSPVAVAELHDLLVDELSLVERWQEASDAGERALELWRAVGDPLREAGTLHRLSRTMWRMCRGSDANAYAESAVQFAEPLGPTCELAQAYSNLARQRMLNSEGAEAIRLARAARELAEPLGELCVLSDAFNTEGCASFSSGLEWSALLERALEIAVSNRLEEQVGRAFANLQNMYIAQLRFPEAAQYYRDGIAYSDEHDLTTFATCLRGSHVAVLLRTSDWDAAEASALELIQLSPPGSINRLSSLQCLATIHARRGQTDTTELLDEMMAAADGTGEAGHVVPARLARAEAYWLAGEVEQARREVELANEVSSNCDPWELGEIAVWLSRIGSNRSARGPIAQPYRFHIEGDCQRAAKE